jgi:tetratricopeptide (TPR) repeat protein
VRHALRARGVVLVQGPRERNPFDIYTDRKLTYPLLADGTLDPVRLHEAIAALAAMVKATLNTSTRRKVSPVYALLPHLEQPQWRHLLLSGANEFSEAHNAWRRRLQTAQQKYRPGDILLLARETPTRALQVEALRAAGEGLLKLCHHDFALEQFEAASAIDPEDPISLRRQAVCLSRLGRAEDAQACVTDLTENRPRDPEAWLQAGRVAKDIWIRRWHPDPASLCQDPDQRPKGDGDGAATRPAPPEPALLRLNAADEDASLAHAIELCQAAFVLDADHVAAGVQTLMLMGLRQHLGGAVDAAALERLTGGVRWACYSAVERRLPTDPPNYPLMACRAELALLLEPLDAVRRHYRNAMATAGRDWFALESSRQTLQLLQALDFRPDETAVARALVDKEQKQLRAPIRPRKVFLFSGHMMDRPDRDSPRFTPAMEQLAAQRIAQVLDKEEAGEDDLALCQAAAGGDLLFLEACIQRGMHIQVLLPFDEATFIRESVEPSATPLEGEGWPMRYYAMQAKLRSPPRLMPDELGPLPDGANPYERCNLWLLNTGLAWGVNKLRFITLWNGSGGDGPGGTAHMLSEVKRRTGRVTWIDTRAWLKPAAAGAVASS